MIKLAGLGVAMGNGVEQLKNNADYITESNNNDGIVNVIQKYLLK